MERLKKEKLVRANIQEGVFNHWSAKRFITPSGKMEFYHEEFVPSGDELPVFRKLLQSTDSPLGAKYPLRFFTANNRYFMHTMFANEPSILEQYMKEPRVNINPTDARARNISDGDVVSIFNDLGNCKVKAQVSEDVPPGVIMLPHGWWPKQCIEGHLQNLVPSIATLETRDKTREIYYALTLERDKKGFKALPEAIFAYSPDTIYDCLCEVKKS